MIYSVVYSGPLSDTLPSVKFKEVSLTVWGHRVKINGTGKVFT
jgi:hypothetical protein